LDQFLCIVPRLVRHSFQSWSACLYATVILLDYSAKTSTTKRQSIMDAALHTDTRSARRHSSRRSHPNSTGAVVDFLCTSSHNSITIGDSTRYYDFLFSITSRVSVDF